MTQFGTIMVERLGEMEKERSDNCGPVFFARAKAKEVEIGATADFRKVFEEYESCLNTEVPTLSEARAEKFGDHFRELGNSYGELLKFLKTRED